MLNIGNNIKYKSPGRFPSHKEPMFSDTGAIFIMKIISIDETAKKYGISKSWIYKKTMAKEISHYKIGHRIFFDIEEFREWFLKQARREAKK